MNIDTIIQALDKATPEQQKQINEHFEQGLDSWAGIVIGQVLKQEKEKLFRRILAGRVNFGEEQPDFQNPSIDAIHSDRLKGY